MKQGRPRGKECRLRKRIENGTQQVRIRKVASTSANAQSVCSIHGKNARCEVRGASMGTSEGKKHRSMLLNDTMVRQVREAAQDPWSLVIGNSG